MKIFYFILLCLPVLFSSPEFNTDNNIDPKIKVDKLEVVFKRNMQLDELSDLQKSLASQEIILQYTFLKFDNDGLSGIGFNVSFKDDFSGSAYTEHLPYREKFGFIRDYTEGASTAFAVGKL